MTAVPEATFAIEKQELKRTFDVAAANYEKHAVLQRTVMNRLLERLALTNLQANSVLDLGSGTGEAARLLAKRYRKARIVELDLSTGMLRHSRQLGPRFFSKQRFVCADAEMLPLADCVIDLVFSNMMLQWCNDLDAAFAESGRVLRPEGLFIFSTLGPDTLKELRLSWGKVDEKVHVNAFLDMHDVGDALVRAGFDAPVLDVERITLTFDDCNKLMQELKHLGAHNLNMGRRRTLTGKTRIKGMLAAYEQFRQENRLPATYEVIYGHAWKTHRPLKKQSTEGNIVSIPVDSLRRKGQGRDNTG